MKLRGTPFSGVYVGCAFNLSPAVLLRYVGCGS